MIPRFPVGTVTVLSTLGDDGPHAIPVSAVHRVDGARIVIALAPGRGSLARIRRRPTVSLTIMAPGVATTLRGSAQVVADPLPEAEFVVAVEITATAVDDALTPRTLIDTGVIWRWASVGDAERDEAVRAALVRLTAQRSTG